MRLVVIIMLLLAAPALAGPDAAALKKANNHFKLGQEFFKSGQWDRAIAEYQAALDLTGEPLLVFNIALAQDRAGRPEEALAGFLKYLELESDGQVADEARQDVARLTPIVDKRKADRAAEAARAAAASQQIQDAAKRQADLARRAEADKLTRVEAAGRADAIDRRARLQRWGGIGLAGVGLAAIGVGLKFGLDARSIASELEAHEGAWTDAQIARDAEGRSANTKMILFEVAGGAALVGGAVLYLYGRGNARRAERLRVDGAIAGGGARVALTLAF